MQLEKEALASAAKSQEPGGVRAGGDVGAAAGTPELGLRDVGGEAGARWR